MHLHREILSLPIFETAPQGYLKLLSLHIKSNFCAPGEYMVHKGDALNNIYLVCNGSMEVLQKDMVVAILGKGDLVGCDIPSTLTIESVIKSSSDVKALTYCDLKCIHVPGLLEVLKLYPEFAETFCTEIVHDLTFNLREGYETDSEGVLHGAHSLTLPSISEDDENNEEDDDNEDGNHGDHSDDSDSPPPSPPPPPPINSSNNFNTQDIWDSKFGMKNKGFGDGVPLLNTHYRRNPSRANQNKSMRKDCSVDTIDIKDQIESTQNSVTKLDSQISKLSKDVFKLSSEMRTTMNLVQKFCQINLAPNRIANNLQVKSSQSLEAIHTFPNRPIGQFIDPTNSNYTKYLIHSAVSSSNASQFPPFYDPNNYIANSNILTINPSEKNTSGTQTEKFLLDDLLCKWVNTDSGSPPPNSGYSSR